MYATSRNPIPPNHRRGSRPTGQSGVYLSQPTNPSSLTPSLLPFIYFIEQQQQQQHVQISFLNTEAKRATNHPTPVLQYPEILLLLFLFSFPCSKLFRSKLFFEQHQQHLFLFATYARILHVAMLPVVYSKGRAVPLIFVGQANFNLFCTV